MMYFIVSIIIIGLYIAGYNKTEIEIPEEGSLELEIEPPQLSLSYPRFSTFLVSTSLGFPPH